MSDWDEDENFSIDGSYEQFHKYDDYFSDNILQNSGLDCAKTTCLRTKVGRIS